MMSVKKQTEKETFNMEEKRACSRAREIYEFLFLNTRGYSPPPPHLIIQLQTRSVLPDFLQMWQRFRINTPRVLSHSLMKQRQIDLSHRDERASRRRVRSFIIAKRPTQLKTHGG